MSVKNNKNSIIALIAGIAFGFLLTINGGVIFIGFVLLIVIAILRKSFPDPSEAAFIILIFILSFFIRSFLCTGFHVYNEIIGKLYSQAGYMGNCIFGDGASASVAAQGLSDIWKGLIDPATFFSLAEGSASKYHYAYAIYDYIFGRGTFFPKFINIFYAVISGVFIYKIAKEIFSKEAAKLSYFITMFFPSLMLWSITYLKESAQLLILTVWIYSLIMLRKNPRRIKYIIVLAASLFFTYLVRQRMMTALICSAVLGVILSFERPAKKAILLTLLLFLTPFLIYCYFGNIDIIFIAKLKLANFLKNIISAQSGVFYGIGYNYHIYPERFYVYNAVHNMTDYMLNLFGWLGYGLKASILFLTVPLPWMINSISQALIFPQLLLWYIVLFFSSLGVINTIIKNNRLSFIIIAFMVVLIIPMAMVSFNMGTAFRYRDMFAPFFIIYASYGFYCMMGKRSVQSGSA